MTRSRYSRLSPVEPIPLLIEGNFRPPKKIRRLQTLVKLCCIVCCFGILSALGIYAINVQLANHLNSVGKKTRDLNEDNKDLVVQLNRVRAFKNIEASAAKLSHLKPAEEVIEINVPEQQRKTLAAIQVFEKRPGISPAVYGY